MFSQRPGGYPGHFFHHLHAVNNPSKDRVPEILGFRTLIIKFKVVHHVDEKLGRGAVDGIGPSHGDGAPLVGKPVIRFIFDAGVGGLLISHKSLPART